MFQIFNFVFMYSAAVGIFTYVVLMHGHEMSFIINISYLTATLALHIKHTHLLLTLMKYLFFYFSLK